MPAPRSNPRLAQTIGEPDTQSRTKAKTALDRANTQQETLDSSGWPSGVAGQPMMRVVMTAAELIPTGQYANVSIGPAQITAFVDADRVLDDGDTYFTESQRTALAQALNELAEIVEGDVIAVQRDLVLVNLQDQVASTGSK